MYNRYIPNGMAYNRVPEEDAPSFAQPSQTTEEPQRPPTMHNGRPPNHNDEPVHTASYVPTSSQSTAPSQSTTPPQGTTASNKPDPSSGVEPRSLFAGLLKRFHLENLDTGDILLLLILVFLVLDSDGDNLELIVTLGLVILFSLGDKKDPERQESD